MLGGQVTESGCELLTVTVKLHEAVAPPEAVQVTVVVPLGKTEPGTGEQVTVALLHPPVAVGIV
jgi:hypothetical protein